MSHHNSLLISKRFNDISDVSDQLFDGIVLNKFRLVGKVVASLVNGYASGNRKGLIWSWILDWPVSIGKLFQLESPRVPEFWISMDEKHQWLVIRPSLDIMKTNFLEKKVLIICSKLKLIPCTWHTDYSSPPNIAASPCASSRTNSCLSAKSRVVEASKILGNRRIEGDGRLENAETLDGMGEGRCGRGDLFTFRRVDCSQFWQRKMTNTRHILAGNFWKIGKSWELTTRATVWGTVYLDDNWKSEKFYFIFLANFFGFFKNFSSNFDRCKICSWHHHLFKKIYFESKKNFQSVFYRF